MARKEALPFKQRFTRNFVIYVFYMVRLFMRLLPFKFGIMLGGLIGRIAFATLKSERRIAIKNLRAAFPEKNYDEAFALAKESFTELGKNLFEILNINKIRKKFDDYVEIEGEEHLRNATKNGGCIYVTGHVGNWELMACYLAYRGFKITPIARELYDEKLNKILIKIREENGVHSILRSRKNTTKKILAALKNNCVLGMLIDQDINVQGIFVDFFGKKAYTTVGVASIAIKFKTDVVAGFIHREGDKHKIVITPLTLIDTGNEIADIESNTSAYTKAVEDAIRKSPAQWVWMHKRWKRKPKVNASKDILNEKN